MSLFEYVLFATSSLFVIADPIAAVPAFMAMTPDNTPAERMRTAKIASGVMVGVLVFFTSVGPELFKLLGISMAAFEVAASIVLLLVGLDMLRAQRSRVHETPEETSAGAEKMDIAVTPLGIPMLAGPGSISTAILLQHKAQDVAQIVGLYVAILLVCGSAYVILHFSARGMQWLSPIALNITKRVMGLLLAAIAVQFMINGITDAFHLSAAAAHAGP